jgi:hypothetical protein
MVSNTREIALEQAIKRHLTGTTLEEVAEALPCAIAARQWQR